MRSHTSATWNPTRISLGHAESRSHGKKRCLKIDGDEPIFGDADRLSLSRSYVRFGHVGNGNGIPYRGDRAAGGYMV